MAVPRAASQRVRSVALPYFSLGGSPLMMATATAISTGILSVEGVIEGVSSTVDQSQVLATASPHNCNLRFKLASSSDRWPRSGALGDFGRS
jgi:hypothetical protein